MELNKDLKIEDSTTSLSDLVFPLDLLKYLGFETKEFKGAKGLKIFYHNSQSGTVLGTEDKLYHCLETYRWSIMGILSNFYNTNYGGYEFLLEYPSLGSTYYNIGSQTSNPVYTSQSVSGYKAIDVNMTQNGGGGLSISSTKGTSTIIDGSPSETTWYYAIGAQQAYSSGIPSNNASVQEVYLGIRIG